MISNPEMLNRQICDCVNTSMVDPVGVIYASPKCKYKTVDKPGKIRKNKATRWYRKGCTLRTDTNRLQRIYTVSLYEKRQLIFNYEGIKHEIRMRILLKSFGCASFLRQVEKACDVFGNTHQPLCSVPLFSAQYHVSPLTSHQQ